MAVLRLCGPKQYNVYHRARPHVAVVMQTPVSCSPSYTSLPIPGEERLEFTPRPGATLTRGNFIRTWQHATLVLTNQDEAACQPSYGQNSVVGGEIRLHAPKSIQRVALKLEGRASLSIAGGPPMILDLLSSKIILWAKDASADSQDESCPSILSFILHFPEAFSNERRTFKLPPSFEAAFLEIPHTIAKCAYTLRISLALSRQYRLTPWPGTNNKSYLITLHYLPRARSRYSFNPAGTVLSTIKTHPNEWLQLHAIMNVKPNAQIKPIDCHFILPASPIYARGDTIPFHIYLCGSSVSLRTLFPPMCSVLLPERDSSSSPGNQQAPNPIRVIISRQVVVYTHEQRSFKNIVIGTGRIWPLPPSADEMDDPSCEVSASWEGEIRLKDASTVPGFNIGNLLVKDYIMLVLTPPKGRPSPLHPLEIVHPIRLCTDSWTESDTMHPDDN